MKKRLQKLTAVLMSALMLSSALVTAPVTAAAAETQAEAVGASSGATGDCTWTLDDEGVLTISGQGAMADYAGNNAAPWGTNIKTVIINSGVTGIGNNAFYNCKTLTGIDIPDSVTSIGSSAFAKCQALTSIIIPDSVTGIADKTFFGCSNLTSVTIGNNVTNIGNAAFGYCSGLTNLTIPDSVISIGDEVFVEGALRTITIPGSVKHIGVCRYFLDDEGGDEVYVVDSVFCDCYFLKIYGYTGTYIEKYAKQYNEKFISLGAIGGVTSDNDVNIKDVTAIQRYLGELEAFNDDQLFFADTNGDGVVNISDATHLQKYLAEYDVVLG